MRVEYDPQTDTLTITPREARIRESDEVRPGVIADFGYDGGVVRFEVLNASDPTREMQLHWPKVDDMLAREMVPETEVGHD